MHVLSSADVVRRLMLIAKRGKWQFVVKTCRWGALSSRSAPSMLVGALFKKFGLFLNTGVYMHSAGIFEELPLCFRFHRYGFL